MRKRWGIFGPFGETPPKGITTVAIAGVLLAAAGLFRLIVDRLAPGVPPFFLLYPAVLLATIGGGWRAGVGVMLIGSVFTWTQVMHHPFLRPGLTWRASDIVNLLLYLVSAAAIVAVAEAYLVSTRRVRSEEARRLERAAAAGRLAIWHFDPVLGLVHGPELNAIFGVAEGVRLTGDDIRGAYVPGELERIRKISAAAFARGERNLEIEARIRRADGEERWVLMRGEMKANAEGLPRASMGFTMDITDRKRADDRRALLAQEVNHRANNLLAVVQGAVRFSKASTPDSLKTVLLGRIAALGHAHQLLSPDRWEVAGLRRLIEEELAAFGYDESQRIVIAGPEVPLGAAAAQALALAVHELATNATKYGALSVAGGQVTLTWSRRGRGPLVLLWSEIQGPAVTAPTRRGQGVLLLEAALGGSLNGGCTLDWRPQGLVCTLTLPAEALQPALVAG